MPLRTLRGHVSIKAESGTDTFTATSVSGFVLAQNIAYSILEGAAYERSELRGNFNKMDSIPGPAGAQISFEVPLKGAGTAGLPPDYGIALLGCGFQEVRTSGTKVEYKAYATFDGNGTITLVSGTGTLNPGPSYSVEFDEDGVRYALKGGWGNVSIDGEVGKPLIAKFSFQGSYVAVSGQAMFSESDIALFVNNTVPPTLLSAGVSCPSLSGVCVFEKVTWDAGNSIALRKNANDSAGIMGALITDRRPTGSIDPEMVLPGTADVYAAWRAGTPGAVSTVTLGSAAGNKLKIDAPRCIVKSLAPADRNQVRTLGLTFDISSLPTDLDGTCLILTVS